MLFYEKEKLMNDDHYQHLSPAAAKTLAKSSFNSFCRSDEWGPRGVLQQADIIFAAWKLLQPKDMRSLGDRLARRYQMLDLDFLRELGKRRSIANAALSSFSACAELQMLAQPSAAFDRFLAVAREQDRMQAEDVRNAIVQSSTFPRPTWLGLAPNG
jgi:hypothetical protein